MVSSAIVEHFYIESPQKVVSWPATLIVTKILLLCIVSFKPTNH